MISLSLFPAHVLMSVCVHTPLPPHTGTYLNASGVKEMENSALSIGTSLLVFPHGFQGQS